MSQFQSYCFKYNLKKSEKSLIGVLKICVFIICSMPIVEWMKVISTFYDKAAILCVSQNETICTFCALTVTNSKPELEWDIFI